MTNKELQELFQSKLGSRKVDFDPSSWEGMERMLDAKMPVTPWYVPLAAWVKGLTAVMVIGFSSYFIIGKPFEGYTKIDPTQNQTEDVFTNKQTTDPSNANSENTGFLNRANQTQSNSNQSQSLSSQDESNASSSKTSNNHSQNNRNSLAYADGDGKRKRKNRRNKETATLPKERFVSNGDLENKPLPYLETVYAEPLDINKSSNNKSHALKSKGNKSPIIWGATFSAVSAKNLFPQTEGSANNTIQPALAFGLRFKQPLGKRWGLSGGLLYKWQQANAKTSNYAVGYGFGEEHVYTDNEYKSLHFLEVPVSTYVHIGQRHALSLGGYAAYLLAAQVQYNQETITQYSTERIRGSSFNNSELSSVWDFGVTAGYHYSINSNFQLGLESWVGLTPIQLIPENESATRNFQLRLSLNYWLF